MNDNLQESLHSAKNRIFWRLRSQLRFRRSGYRETGAEKAEYSNAELGLERAYGLGHYKTYLSEVNYRRNLWTLWALDRVLAPHLRELKLSTILEPGCQDFSRLPALRSFLGNFGNQLQITGLELDPFPVLRDLHSRWDKAHYYLGLDPLATKDEYHEADFFFWDDPADLICCFYPFVSSHPALAWGLPASFGDASAWLSGFERNLRPGGLLFVVHQGEWEEEEFDSVREHYQLELLSRESLNCPFYSVPYPACASVYRRKNLR